MKLSSCVALVTGAASGIGFETARLFASEGARVVVADKNTDAARQAVEAIGREVPDAPEADAVMLDVTDEAAVNTALDDVVARHGRLDILVNNAGFGFAGTVANTALEDWEALFAVNVRGVFLGCKHAVPIFERQGGGVIVNTASAGAVVGIPNRAAYTASKGAVAALTRAMAIDHTDARIRVNCVAPGTIETPYFAEIFDAAPDAASLRKGLEERQIMNRLGRPDEIAKAILFLACDDSSFCTGSTLVVDGGWTIR